MPKRLVGRWQPSTFSIVSIAQVFTLFTGFRWTSQSFPSLKFSHFSQVFAGLLNRFHRSSFHTFHRFSLDFSIVSIAQVFILFTGFRWTSKLFPSIKFSVFHTFESILIDCWLSYLFNCFHQNSTFQCDQCENVFRNKKDLNIHKDVNTNAK